MSNILISLAAEFVGKKAFSDASKSTVSLEKQVKKLGKTLGLSLSTAAVVAYGKASVKAFAADEAAAQRLTTAVNNLGLSFANIQVSKFISDLEMTAAVADDDLRPAFQALLTTTGSLAQSQNLLNLAIEVSRGSGIDLLTVSKDLANAYVGNTRGLRKYNLGLTQAELKTASFAAVQAKLNAQFSGSNAAYLETTAGKLTALSVAAGKLSEAIGGALVEAFIVLSGSSGVGDLISKIDILATKITKFADAMEVFAYRVKVSFSLEGLLKGQDYIDKKVAEFERKQQYEGVSGFDPGNNSVTGFARDEAAKKAAEAAARKRAAELAKLAAAQVKAQKALTAEQKKQALAKKQSALFDLEQIGLVAALKGNLSEEERLRVKLQLALLTDNTSEAEKLSKQLVMSIDSTGKLAAYLSALPDAKNPFLGWDEWLKNFTKNLANVTGSSIPTTNGGVSPAPITSAPTSNAVDSSIFNSLGSANASTRTADEARRLYGGMGSSQPTIVVQIDGKAIASSLQDQNLSGVDSTVNRLLGQFR